MRGSALRGLLQLRSRCVTPCICAAVPRGFGAAPRSLGAPFSSGSSGSGSGLTGGRLPTGGQSARPEHDGFAWQPLDNDPPHSARDVPCPTDTRVVDYAGALTPSMRAELDARLAALHDAAGGAEVLVLTLRDIRACTGWRGAAVGSGRTPHQLGEYRSFSEDVFARWGVGGAGGNGVLVTLFKDGRRVEMHAGAALAAR